MTTKMAKQIRACRNELLIHKEIKSACQKLLTKVYAQDDALSFKNDISVRNGIVSLNHTSLHGIDSFFSARNRLLRDKFIQNLKKVLKQVIEKKGKLSSNLTLNGFKDAESAKETLSKYVTYLDAWAPPKLPCSYHGPGISKEVNRECVSNRLDDSVCYFYTLNYRYRKDGERCWVSETFIEDYLKNYEYTTICSSESNSELKCNDNSSDVWKVLALAAQMTFGKTTNVSRGRSSHNIIFTGMIRNTMTVPYSSIVISNDNQSEFAIHFNARTLIAQLQ